MDDATKDQLSRFVENLNTAVERGAEFTMEQTPLVAQEMVAYGRAYYTVLVTASALAFAIGGILLYRHSHKWCKVLSDTQNSAEFAAAFSKLLVVVLMVPIAGGCAMANLDMCLKVWFAPRLYIIEEIARLLK